MVMDRRESQKEAVLRVETSGPETALGSLMLAVSEVEVRNRACRYELQEYREDEVWS